MDQQVEGQVTRIPPIFPLSLCQAGFLSIVSSVSGVSGMRGDGSVKCLHTHYAHYLARPEESLIGRWVNDIVEGRLHWGMMSDSK